jgi:hypothetical protein
MIVEHTCAESISIIPALFWRTISTLFIAKEILAFIFEAVIIVFGWGASTEKIPMKEDAGM